ncbi:Pyruvate/2-oxoacid:ferredoxin oxidoreductase delta subunit [Clostridiales Family XIII bacterium PM5-7]
MQLTDRVKHCNGCEACLLGCKYACIKMVKDEHGRKTPMINEDGCQKCNNCFLYCPIYNPVELPNFQQFYEYMPEHDDRDMAKLYRETLRKVKAGETTEFVGTLCQIAGLKSVMGDKLSHDLVLYPLYCDPENPRRPECEQCIYCKSEK